MPKNNEQVCPGTVDRIFGDKPGCKRLTDPRVGKFALDAIPELEPCSDINDCAIIKYNLRRQANEAGFEQPPSFSDDYVEGDYDYGSGGLGNDSGG